MPLSAVAAGATLTWPARATVWGSSGLGENERFSSICVSQRNKIKFNLRGQRSKGGKKGLCPCHYKDGSFSSVSG